MDGKIYGFGALRLNMKKPIHSPEIVGGRLERIRIACDIGTQADMARLLGVSPTRLNNWVKGDNLLPVPYAYKLKQLTGVTLDYIYCGDVSSLPIKLSISLRHDNSSL